MRVSIAAIFYVLILRGALLAQTTASVGASYNLSQEGLGCSIQGQHFITDREAFALALSYYPSLEVSSPPNYRFILGGAYQHYLNLISTLKPYYFIGFDAHWPTEVERREWYKRVNKVEWGIKGGVGAELDFERAVMPFFETKYSWSDRAFFGVTVGLRYAIR